MSRDLKSSGSIDRVENYTCASDYRQLLSRSAEENNRRVGAGCGKELWAGRQNIDEIAEGSEKENQGRARDRLDEGPWK